MVYKRQLPRIGWINGLGLWTCYLKEVRRFLSIAPQSIIAPLVTTILFYLVFILAFGSERDLPTLSFSAFLIPGLIMLAIMQNAFANPSFALVISKVQGNVVDIFLPPLTMLEIVLAYSLAGMSRGIAVGITTGGGLALIAPAGIYDMGAIVFYGCMGSLMLSLLGVIGGALANKFDHIAAVTNFIIMPLSFLSGTFYSLDKLPAGLAKWVTYNPFFHVIDGFRYSMTGFHEGSLVVGSWYLIILNILLAITAWVIFQRGYCLKD